MCLLLVVAANVSYFQRLDHSGPIVTVTSTDDVTYTRRHYSYLPRLDHSGPIVTVTSPDDVTRHRRHFSYFQRLDHSGPIVTGLDGHSHVYSSVMSRMK